VSVSSVISIFAATTKDKGNPVSRAYGQVRDSWAFFSSLLRRKIFLVKIPLFS
jgi:hypothetical protein